MGVCTSCKDQWPLEDVQLPEFVRRMSAGSSRGRHHSSLSMSPGRVEDFYHFTIGDIIGQGAFGKVRVGTQRGTDRRLAIKEIRKRTEDKRFRRARGMTAQQIMQEAGALHMLKHPNILKLHSVYEDHVNVYLVMDLCDGGDLYDALREAKSFGEKQVATLMQKILLGVNFMHHQHVCHRDLKPDNFLLGSKPDGLESCDLRIVDFGCAWNFASADETNNRMIGTAQYMAPEMINGLYTHRCDNFSVGVVAFLLLCGTYPFATTRATQVAEVSFRHPAWRQVSNDARLITKGLLHKNAQTRCTASQALQHPWIQSQAPNATDTPLPSLVFDSLRRFCSESLLKKAVLNTIAQTCREEDLHGLRELFVRLDGNQDGTISVSELDSALAQSISGDIRLVDLMRGMDLDGDGRIDYREFVASLMEKQQYQSESACWVAFKKFDVDGNGTISMEELRQVLADPMLQGVIGDKSIDEVFQQCDADHDGKISFEEFYSSLK